MNSPISPSLDAYDNPSKMLNIISFLCPPLGLIIYLALVSKLPRQATSAGTSATKGVRFYITAVVVLTLLSAIAGIGFWFLDDVLHVWGQPQIATDVVAAHPPMPN